MLLISLHFFGIYYFSQSEVLVFVLISQIRIYFFHLVQKVPHPVTLLGKIKVFSHFLALIKFNHVRYIKIVKQAE